MLVAVEVTEDDGKIVEERKTMSLMLSSLINVRFMTSKRNGW